MSTLTASLRMFQVIEVVPDRLDGSPRQLRRFWFDKLRLMLRRSLQVRCEHLSDRAAARNPTLAASLTSRILSDSEHGQIAAREELQKPAAGAHCVVKISIGNAPARASGHCQNSDVDPHQISEDRTQHWHWVFIYEGTRACHFNHRMQLSYHAIQGVGGTAP
jgi:transposase